MLPKSLTESWLNRFGPLNLYSKIFWCSWDIHSFMIKICLVQKQPLEVFYKKGVLKNSTEKKLCSSLFLIKLQALGKGWTRGWLLYDQSTFLYQNQYDVTTFSKEASIHSIHDPSVRYEILEIWSLHRSSHPELFRELTALKISQKVAGKNMRNSSGL